MTALYATSGTPVSLYDTSGKIVFGAPQQPEATPPEAVDTSTWATARHIANNAAWWRFGAQASSNGGHIVTRHDVRSPGRALQFRYGQFAEGSTNQHGGSQFSGMLTVVHRGAEHYPTWGGSRHVTIPFGSSLLSDPLDGIVVQPGDVLYTVWDAAPGSVIPTGSHSIPGQHSTRTVYDLWDFTTRVASATIAGSPVQIVGLTDPVRAAKSVLLVGDSFLEIGWGKRALERHGMAWSDMSLWMETTPQDRTQIANRIGPTGTVPFDVIVTAYGGNDKGGTLAQQQQTHLTHWRMLEATGAKLAACTLHPYTNSTDHWVTVGAQTIRLSNESDRTGRNDWLRDGAPIDSADNPLPTGTTDAAAIRIGDPRHPLDFPVFDQADACETARNSGIWKTTGGAWTVDGAHLTQHGSDMLQPHFEQWVTDNLT